MQALTNSHAHSFTRTPPLTPRRLRRRRRRRHRHVRATVTRIEIETRATRAGERAPILGRVTRPSHRASSSIGSDVGIDRSDASIDIDRWTPRPRFDGHPHG